MKNLKKFFAVLAVLPLFLAGCEEPSTPEEEGPYPAQSEPSTWLTVANESFIELTEVVWGGVSFGAIPTGGNSAIKKVSAGTGYLTFKANGISLRRSEIVTVEEDKTTAVTILDATVVTGVSDSAKTGPLSTMGVPASLKIKNESFTELTNVTWGGVPFANNSYENSIKTGTSVTRNVSNGAGYIFFRRKSNPLAARASDMVIIEEGDGKEFTFTDATAIVEINNAGNTGTLGGLQSTVVFFDDAEGGMQQYHAKQTFVGYYNMNTTLDNGDSASSYKNNISAVKDGQKSIAVGGTYTAKLHLRVDLARPAKLTFWVANKRETNNSGNTKFSINGAVQETWSTSMDWSFQIYNLTAGKNDIVWEKTDGYYYYNGYGDYYFYLSLDDVLIYYTD
ncbi:MAG: hypothetical protein LBD37_10265 [Treponema sp.]|jgi:hypothetical protein|nr:hypothetical protein [Treponema sp.]